jgi:hypothetical protein
MRQLMRCYPVGTRINRLANAGESPAPSNESLDRA